MPPGGLNIRLGDSVLGQEARLHDYKRDAMLAFVRANKLNRMITLGRAQSEDRRHHRRQELSRRAPGARRARPRRGQVQRSRPAPLQGRLPVADQPPRPDGVRPRPRTHHRGRGEALADRGAGPRGALRHRQPAGLHRQEGRARQLAVPGQGRARSERRRDLHRRAPAQLRPQRRASRRGSRGSRRRSASLAETEDIAVRIPYFCSGCPHNSSTVVPEGSRAYAGIGCHYMAQWMDRSTSGYTQMGGEGANWIGEAPFSKRAHVFQNLGDGTYNHSGSLAIRAAIASGVNITYKILFNDAVAMTGGQRNDGDLTVPQIAAEIAAEGAKRVVVVTDEPSKYPVRHQMAGRRHDPSPRRAAGGAEGAARRSPGCTVLIYDQTCAAEKRRRRKRGTVSRSGQARHHQRAGLRGLRRLRREVELRVGAAARDRVRPQAHHRPVELQQGFLLREGLLSRPSSRWKARSSSAAGASTCPRTPTALPSPTLPAIDKTFGMIVTGIGGTGIVTIGAHPRHGGASRGQGRRHHRHGRARAEGRRGGEPHPLRQPARGHPRHPRRRALGRPRARRRHRGRRQQEGACRGEAGNHRDDHQPRRDAARRVHAQSRILAADRAAQAHDLVARRSQRTRISSMRRRCRRRCSASRSAPTCSCSAMPISSARCRSRRKRSRRRSR